MTSLLQSSPFQQQSAALRPTIAHYLQPDLLSLHTKIVLSFAHHAHFSGVVAAHPGHCKSLKLPTIEFQTYLPYRPPLPCPALSSCPCSFFPQPARGLRAFSFPRPRPHPLCSSHTTPHLLPPSSHQIPHTPPQCRNHKPLLTQNANRSPLATAPQPACLPTAPQHSRPPSPPRTSPAPVVQPATPDPPTSSRGTPASSASKTSASCSSDMP